MAWISTSLPDLAKLCGINCNLAAKLTGKELMSLPAGLCPSRAHIPDAA